jgi:F-type H+-transporting ATPase subunit epsilon
MASTKLHLEIVTPEALAYSEEVDAVVVPGLTGELGILPGHIPLMTQVLPGELRVTRDNQEVLLAVGQGFLEVTATRVSVLTDMAVQESEIDESLVEEAIRRAEERMASEQLDTEDMAMVQASLQKSLAQLKVKRRRQT